MQRIEFFGKLVSMDFTKTERLIVYFYYYEQLTMDGVATKIKLSESRVSQMHAKIINKLRAKVQRNPGFFGKDVLGYIKPTKNRNRIFGAT